MGEAFLKFRMLFAFLRLVKDPRKTEEVFKLSTIGRRQKSKLVDPSIQYILGLPGASEMRKGSWELSSLGPKELIKFPEASFGQIYAQHMIEQGLDPEFFPLERDQSDEAWILNRARVLHDYWHVLTGFDTSIPGEVALQAFTFAQLRSPFSALLMAGGILHGLSFGQKDFLKIMECLFQGYEMGKRAQKIFGLPLEKYLDENLETLRGRMGITPGHQVLQVGIEPSYQL